MFDAQHNSFSQCVAVFCVLCSSLHAAVVWPLTDADWVPLTTGGGTNLYQDVVDTNPDTTDIVGDSNFAAAHWHYQDNGTASTLDDQILFRIRINDQPNKDQGTWQIVLNTDADTGVDFVLQYDASGNPDAVELLASINEGPTIGDVTFDTDNPAWQTTSTADYIRWEDPTGDGSDVGGDGSDVFLDIGIPWTDFSAATGLDLGDSMSIGVTTGSSNQINKDVPLGQTTASATTTIFSDAVTIPEPSSVTLLALAGIILAWTRRKCLNN